MYFSLFTCVAAQAQGCSYTLHGHIYDTEGLPLPGIYVTIKEADKRSFTNPNGYFEINNLCAGNYLVEYSAIGYEPITKEIQIQGNQHINITLEESLTALSTVEVIGEKKVSALSSQTVSTLEEDDLKQTYGKSLGEALERITGVNTLSTGATIQKPMIHGLHSNRLVILNNGVRLESQRWGAEHAPEMDPFLAKQLSVVKGAAGVQYGAEAIGGVVIANPSTLPLASPWQGEMHLIGMSNGRQGVFSATLEKGSQKIKGLGWRLQGTLKRGGDLQAADYSLTNTAHSEANFSVGVGWQNARWQTEAFYSYFSTTLGILRSAHIGNLDNLESAINRQEPFVTENFSYDINNPKQ
ncbi:MAG: TonB-dependent receptor plug domain-containing protein [Thermonemataceae bacterium]